MAIDCPEPELMLNGSRFSSTSFFGNINETCMKMLYNLDKNYIYDKIIFRFQSNSIKLYSVNLDIYAFLSMYFSILRRIQK